MMRLIAYARVSTAEQSLSVEAQLAQMRSYASLYSHEIVAQVTDQGASGKSLDRPGWHAVAAKLDKGEVDGVLVAKLDRLTRSVRDLGDVLERFTKAKLALVSVAEQLDTATATGRMIMNLLATVSQWERETIGERTRTALAHKRSRGERTGSIPFGWCPAADAVHLDPVPAEQRQIARTLALRAQGMSLARISAALAAEGGFSRSGRPHAPAQIARMIELAKLRPLQLPEPTSLRATA